MALAVPGIAYHDMQRLCLLHRLSMIIYHMFLLFRFTSEVIIYGISVGDWHVVGGNCSTTKTRTT